MNKPPKDIFAFSTTCNVAYN